MKNKLCRRLSVEEINKILKCAKKAKHRILIELIYGCGLTAGQAVSLRYSDIDLISGRLSINKRQLNIPLRLLNLLRHYFSSEKIKEYVISTVHGKMSVIAAENIIKTISFYALNREVCSQEIINSSFEHKLALNFLNNLLSKPKLENCPQIQISYSGQFSFRR